MARNVQQIFNKVIKDGYYPAESSYSSIGMCLSLVRAKREGSITTVDMIKADDAIYQYMRKCGYAYLSGALEASNLPHDTEAMLKVYKDWKNRPQLTCRLD